MLLIQRQAVVAKGKRRDLSTCFITTLYYYLMYQSIALVLKTEGTLLQIKSFF